MAQILLVGLPGRQREIVRHLAPRHEVIVSAPDRPSPQDSERGPWPDLVLVEACGEGWKGRVTAFRGEGLSTVAFSHDGDGDGALDGAPLVLPRQIELVLWLAELLPQQRPLRGQLEFLRRREAPVSRLADLVGRSRSMCAVIDELQRLTNYLTRGANLLLLQGETGTGKGRVAQTIHCDTARRNGSFVRLACLGRAPEQLERELFEDHWIGAHHPHRTADMGLVDIARGGTLYIDEISCLPLLAQSRLLSLITKERAADGEERAPDGTRSLLIIAGTKRDLSFLVEQDRFRLDLLHRLQKHALEMPPLRDRGSDIVRLADHFLQQLARRYDQPVKQLSEASRRLIRRYSWPGNLEELRNVMEHVVLLQDSPVVEPHHLRLVDRLGAGGRIEVDLPARGVSLDDIDRRVLAKVLELCAGNVSEAARYLRTTRSTLRYRLKKLGLSTERFKTTRTGRGGAERASGR